MLREIWQIAKTALLIVGVALTFFAFVEVVQAYNALRDMHPVAGYVFLAILGCLAIALLLVYLRRVASMPPVLKVPETGGPPEEADLVGLKIRGRYLLKYLACLRANRNVSDEQRGLLSEGHDELERALKRPRSREELVETIAKAEGQVIEPVLVNLDREVDDHIQRCVRDVMVGVTVSPFRSVDLLVVVARTFRMVVGIIQTYRGRPRLREQLAILHDTLRVVAYVNYMNLGEKLFEKLCASVPYVGGYVDDIAQGIGAGVLTSAAGHAVKHRCRAYRSWNEVEAQKHLKARLPTFLRDCGHMARDLFGNRIPQKTWEQVQAGLSKGVERTAEIADAFVRQPVAKAAGAGSKATGRAWKRFGDGIKGAGRAVGSAGKRVGRVGRAAGRSVSKGATRLNPFRRKKDNGKGNS